MQLDPCLLDREVAGPVVVWMAAPADAALTPVDGLKDALRSGLALVISLWSTGAEREGSHVRLHACVLLPSRSLHAMPDCCN